MDCVSTTYTTFCCIFFVFFVNTILNVFMSIKVEKEAKRVHIVWNSYYFLKTFQKVSPKHANIEWQNPFILKCLIFHFTLEKESWFETGKSTHSNLKDKWNHLKLNNSPLTLMNADILIDNNGFQMTPDVSLFLWSFLLLLCSCKLYLIL